MGKPNVYVFGWFSKGNLGDDSFKQAYLDLWGNRVNFTFSNEITPDVNSYDACFIGGGSFLDQPLHGSEHIKIPLGLIGVGIHDLIHPHNEPLLKNAKIIISRNSVFTP